MQDRYINRMDAAHRLAEALEGYRGRGDLLVLGLPRGGVPVAFGVAQALGAPLDVMLVRKLGVPGREELAMGAVATGGVRVLNDDVISLLDVPDVLREQVTERNLQELARRERALRGSRPPPDLTDRCVLLIDDGLATGATMRAAVRAARLHAPKQVVVAVPVGSPRTVEALSEEADEVVCPRTPAQFFAVGICYEDFGEVTDDDVRALLERAWSSHGAASSASRATARYEAPVEVQAGPVTLEGDLHVPAEARGLVIFAHGSGSSRRSPRNRAVASTLHDAGLGTLLFDLLTPREEQTDRVTGDLRFDIPLLAERLVGAVDWAASFEATRALPVGLFGASTGAAAALLAAADRPEQVKAVVSRGGRPDLAIGVLHQVTAPTLLIVGGRDVPVIDMNRQAAAQLDAEHRLEIVPGATHLFEEPGALEQVARLACQWFERHL